MLILFLAAAVSLPKPVVELVDRARSVPPEFGADALLRIAESDTLRDAAARRELIEEAFRLAGAAQEPIKRRAIKPGSADSRINFQARAYAQDLDTLSLQSRAVADMLRVDKRQAREMFSQIAPPRVPRLACADLLVYDVSAYYEALGQIAAEADAKFLAGFAGRISSPAEVGPMAKAIAGFTGASDQLQMLITVFTASLKSQSADDRSFSFAASSDGKMLADLNALLTAAKGRKVSTIALVEAVREYLTRHLTTKRCSDNSGITVSMGLGNPNPVEQLDAVAYFNNRIRAEVYPPDSRIEPLGGEEIRANGLEDPVPEQTSWRGQESRDLADRFNGLLFDPTGTAWSSDYRSGAEWQAKLREFLAALADWKADQEPSAAEYFYRKCYLLSSLVNVVPNGPARELVLRGFLDFLRRNTYQQTNRLEWFLPVNTLLLRITTDPALASLAEEMRSTGDPVMAMYANLDRLMPRSPAKAMALL
jgi:hypothetical protein